MSRKRPARKLHTAIHAPNGMVICFDDRDEQIPHLQGRYEVVRQAVLDAADSETVFRIGAWGVGTPEVIREEW